MLIVYGLAGSSGLWLDSLMPLLIGRVLLGFSVAGIMTTVTTLIADYYTGAMRGQVLGFQSSFMALGGVVFLSVGGFLAEINWRMPFASYLIAILLAVCVALLLPEPDRSTAAVQSLISTPDEPVDLPLQWVFLTFGIALLTQIVFHLIPVQLPFYLNEIANVGASQSGLAIAFLVRQRSWVA
ncbi:MAG TPA: MFS transporter [Elainellaceae cyanobacterium]